MAVDGVRGGSPRARHGEEIALDARLTGELRAQATAPHSLVLAGLLVLGIGVCAVRYLNSDSARSRRRYLAAILVQLLGLGATNQRTGFLALAAVVLLLGVAQVRRLPSAMPLVIAGIIGAGAVALVSPNTPRLVLNFFTGQTTDHNVTVRITKYALLPELVGRRPVIGAGYLTGDPSIVIFDNAYLTQLVELGIVGLTLLIGFLLVVGARPFSKYLEAPREDQPFLVAAMCAAVTLLVTMATFDVLSFGQLFPTCLIVLAIGAARADALEPRRSAPSSPSRPSDAGALGPSGIDRKRRCTSDSVRTCPPRRPTPVAPGPPGALGERPRPGHHQPDHRHLLGDGGGGASALLRDLPAAVPAVFRGDRRAVPRRRRPGADRQRGDRRPLGPLQGGGRRRVRVVRGRQAGSAGRGQHVDGDGRGDPRRPQRQGAAHVASRCAHLVEHGGGQPGSCPSGCTGPWTPSVR